jgi:hypothetical protein
LYPKAWHSLLIGEDEETQAKVKNDILTWLNKRTEQPAPTKTNGGK